MGFSNVNALFGRPGKLWITGYLALQAGCSLWAGELGTPAPPLQGVSWVKGDAVSLNAWRQTNVYVVTFLETWCSSCMAVLPDLWRLQEQTKPQNVVFVGVFAESNAVVKGFCENEEVKSKLSFAIACDEQHKTYDRYMTAFGRTKVPRSFVVDQQGMVVWEGPPSAGLEETLNEVLAGKFDLERAKKVEAADRLQEDYFTMIAGEPGFRLLSADTNATAARGIGNQIVRDGATSPWLLNNFAWRILTEPKVRSRDLDLASESARAAVAADKRQNPSFSDTYAKALFQMGKVTEAIAMQRHAVDIAQDKAHRASLERTLKTYEEAEKTPPVK